MKSINFLLVGVIVLAAILRLYQLGNVPPAAYGDEISFAWNAYSILKTGADEYGIRYPLQFRAFDDYKAPIPVYLLVPVIKILGLNTFAIRLPVALFAIATVPLIFLLVKKLLSEKIALIAAFLIAISPWHIHLSRGYFESTIALFFLVCGIYLFVRSQEKIFYLIFSSLFFVLSVYTYFTPRIMLLFFIPFLLLWGKKNLIRHKKYLIGAFFIVAILTMPLVKATFFDKGLSRINKLTAARTAQIEKEVILDRNSVHSPDIIRKVLHNRIMYLARDISNDYLEHFSLNFMYLQGDSSLRYFLGNMGIFYLYELPFFIVGIYYMFKEHRKVWYLLMGWLLIAPIPTAIVGRPFAVRSLAMLPVPLIFSATGIYYAFQKLHKKSAGMKVVKLYVILFSVFAISAYTVRYFLEYPSYAATWWGWENKSAINLALKEKDHFDQIIISNYYSGVDLAFAYYAQYDPVAYREAKNNTVILADGKKFLKLGKFYIGSLDIDEKRLKDNIIPAGSLYIGGPYEVKTDEAITAPDDGRVLFNIYRTL